MKISAKDIIKPVLIFGLATIYFFYKYATNTKGLIINGIFKLNVGQANIFYITMGVLSICSLIICCVTPFLINRKV